MRGAMPDLYLCPGIPPGAGWGREADGAADLVSRLSGPAVTVGERSPSAAALRDRAPCRFRAHDDQLSIEYGHVQIVRFGVLRRP